VKNSRFLTLESLQVRYFDNGRGEDLVLLHGFCGSSEIWEKMVPALESRFRIICIDLPGHGESESIPGMHDLTELARWLNKVTSKLGLKEFTLVGHSLGGYIAMAFAEVYAEKLKGIGLFHSMAAADSEERAERRDRIIEFVEELGPAAYLRTFVPSLVHDYNPMLLKRLLEISAQTQNEAIIAYTEAMRDRIDRRFVLENLDIPILFIAGENDELITIRQVRDEKLLSEQGMIFVLPGVGHVGMLESVDESVMAFFNFLSMVKLRQ
jgi:pimeloyl-ACP methyl ester carboxylesterase